MLSANVFPLVSPVVDYEPPAFGGPPVLPPARRVRPGRPAPVDTGRPAAENPDARSAALFADAALRRVLEVLDRRRPLVQLRGLLAPGLVDSLLSAAGGRPNSPPARLRRVLAQPVAGTAAEVSASYTRGERVHAVACRVEQLPTATGPRWQVVALHLG